MSNDTSASKQEYAEALSSLGQAFENLICVMHTQGKELYELEESFLAGDIRNTFRKYAGKAFENIDSRLVASQLKEGFCLGNKEGRSILSVFGNIDFKRHVVHDRRTKDVLHIYPLDLELGLEPRGRISLYTQELVCKTATEASSYAKCASIFARMGTGHISAASIGHIVGKKGVLIKEEQRMSARDMFEDGIYPEGKIEAPELFLEADGTYVKGWRGLPAPQVRSASISSAKTKDAAGRGICEHHNFYAGVESASHFWKGAVAATFDIFSLGALTHITTSSDGEAAYKNMEGYLPKGTYRHTQQIDNYHIMRYVEDAFVVDPNTKKKDQNALSEVTDCLFSGDVQSAVELLYMYAKQGICDKGGAVRAGRYLINNRNYIVSHPSSLGTQEGMQYSVYKIRMGGARGWTRRGADAMARLLAASMSEDREIPPFDVEHLLDLEYAMLDELGDSRPVMSAAEVPVTTGKGYEYGCRGSIANLGNRAQNDHTWFDEENH